MKKGLLKDIATSSTTLVFLVVGITGVLMYFHLFDAYTKQMHEILGLVFVVAALIHVFVNFKQMKQYFLKKIFFVLSLVLLSVVVVFTLNVEDGSNPKRVAIEKVLKSPIEQTFVLFSDDKDELIMKLEDKGIKFNNEKTILEIAKANDTSPFRIVSILSN